MLPRPSRIRDQEWVFALAIGMGSIGVSLFVWLCIGWAMALMALL